VLAVRAAIDACRELDMIDHAIGRSNDECLQLQ
jgi:hypothetical protein